MLFRGITIDLSKVVQIAPPPPDPEEGVETTCIFKDCVLKDPNGATGPAQGYWSGNPSNEVGQILFRNNEGQRVCLLECEVVNYIATGAWLYHGCDITVSADSVFLSTATASSGASIWNTTASQPSEFKQRRHLETILTVAGAQLDGSNTQVSWANSPTLSNSSELTNQNVDFLTGDLAGGQDIHVVSQSDSGDYTVIEGDKVASIDAGDTAWVYIIFHADTFQTVRPSGRTFHDTGSGLSVSVNGATEQFVLNGASAWLLKPEVGDAIVVDGFTGNDAVNNGWFTVTAVTDTTITVAEDLTTAGQASNVTITGHSTEPPIENVFVQRYKAVGITAQPLFLQRNGVDVPSYVTVSVNGTTATFTRAHGLVVGDLVRVGTLKARIVASVNSATQVTFSEAINPGVVGVPWEICKSVKDFGFQLCIFDKTQSSPTLTQVQNGASHVVMRRCTHLGTGWIFRTDNAGFGVHGVAITDSIFEAMSADASPGFPTDGVRIDNNLFETGSTRGSNAILGDGAGTTVDDTTYRPTANSDANGELEDARNYLGYDYYGDVTDTSQSNKSIGAVGEP